MTLSELRTICRKRLGDAGGAFWSDAEIDGYINDACRDISFRTKSIKAEGYLTTVTCSPQTASEGTREWVLTTQFPGIYSVEDVYFNKEGTDWIKLTPTSRDDLNNERPGWLSSVGYTSGSTYNYNSTASCPTSYYWDREEDVIGVEPPPNDDNAGSDYVRVFYTKVHTDISGENDEPGIPEPLHLASVNHVVASGFEDRGWGDRANDQWEKYFKRLRDYLIETGREREDEEIIMKNYRSL